MNQKQFEDFIINKYSSKDMMIDIVNEFMRNNKLDPEEIYPMIKNSLFISRIIESECFKLNLLKVNKHFDLRLIFK